MKFFNRQLKTSSGFTLVELLLVISILAILSSLSLVVISGAQNDARRAATQSLLAQIDEILKQRMEDYEVRRIPFPLTDYTGVFVDENTDGIRNRIPDPTANPPIVAENEIERGYLREVRQRILADIINSEMPREFEDVAWRGSANFSDTNFPGPRFTDWLNDEIGNGFLSYGGQIQSLIEQDNLLVALQGRAPVLATRFQVPGSSNPDDYPDDSSEYLYRILQATDYEGTPAIDYLRGNSIGDTDGDGFPEIVDAWGNPLVFGLQVFDDDGNYVAGDIQISQVLFRNNGNEGLNPGQAGDAPAVQNLQIRILSTGGITVNDISDLDGAEIISN